MTEPADAPNPAIALRFAVGCRWRGVGDPYRWLQKGKAAMQTNSISMLCVFLSVLGCVCACRPPTQPEALSPHPDYRDSLNQDATETYMAHVKAFKPGAGNDVPSDYWAEGIKALQPVTGEIEQGKYIQVSVSSYIPRPGDNDDGFEFRLNPNGVVHDFKRVKPTVGESQPVSGGNAAQPGR
jgi:hypothetical protein